MKFVRHKMKFVRHKMKLRGQIAGASASVVISVRETHHGDNARVDLTGCALHSVKNSHRLE